MGPLLCGLFGLIILIGWLVKDEQSNESQEHTQHARPAKPRHAAYKQRPGRPIPYNRSSQR